MKILRYVLMVLLPLIVLTVGWNVSQQLIASKPVPETRAPEIVKQTVVASELVPESARLTVSAEGTVQAGTRSEISAEVPGRVVWVAPAFDEGEFFEEGDELIKIDPMEYELELVRAQAAIAQAKLRIATEEEEAAVAKEEWAALGEGTPSPLVTRKPQLAEAKAALASAEAALRKAEYDLERTVVKAPFRGRILTKNADRGQFVARGQSLARAYSVDYAEVKLPIPDADLAYLRVPLAYRNGDGKQYQPRVKLIAEFAGREHSWSGRIVRTEGEIDPETRMVRVVARVADPYGNAVRGRPPLAVGMFVRAEIYGNTLSGVVSVPRDLMRPGNQILVADGGDALRLRDVDIVRIERERVLIRSGFQDGDRLITSAVEVAVDGTAVDVIAAEGKES